jgi:hypothetical protein
MAFRRHPTLEEQWQAYCLQRRALLATLQRMVVAFSSSVRFADLLERGLVETKDQSIRLDSLSDDEWNTLLRFVTDYRREWETWFVETLYPAWFREVARRDLTISPSPQSKPHSE